MDWENLRFFLAVAQTGSLAAAGRQLGVIHTTVMRRIAVLETGLGSKLFERHPSGYALTPTGQELLETLQPFAEELIAVERKLSGQDQQLTGTVRIATLGLLSPWVCEALAHLRQANPEVRIELTVSTTNSNFARHETDVALRVTASPPEYLVGRRLAELAHGIYAASDHPAALQGAVPYTEHAWLTYSDSRKDLPHARWVTEHIPENNIVMRTNHTKSLASAAAAGIGLALLPCYLGDRHPGLKRLELLRGLGLDLWLLTHQDLRRNRRIRVVMDCLAAEISKHRALIEGNA